MLHFDLKVGIVVTIFIVKINETVMTFFLVLFGSRGIEKCCI